MMKLFTRLVFLLACFMVCNLAQAATVVVWTLDTPSGFDVTLSGTGLPTATPGRFYFGDNGPFVSPSGLWRLAAGDQAIWPSPTGGSQWEFNGGGRVTFIPDFGFGPGKSLDFLTYSDFFPNVMPVQDGNTAGAGELHDIFGWTAGEHIEITSEPNPADPTTWTWINHYGGSGRTLLALAVPESGIIPMLLLAVLGIFASSRVQSLKRGFSGKK
jgi:hypothetical protein